MSETTGLVPAPSATCRRTAEILAERSEAGYRTVDRMFALLLIVEWLASIVEALVVSPSTWAGEIEGVHPHVWAAVVLGGLAVSLPVALAVLRPGRSSTRQCVAIGQMLLVALMIHLSGGRPESHFHLFGSLAFLALYRDWRVMITASVVIAADHFLGGIYWPRSVFGNLEVGPWRWVEHTLWVAFEDVILIYGMSRSCALMGESSRQQAEVEATRDRVESVVFERTAELMRANAELMIEVAERSKAEAEAHRSRQAAEQATRAKSEFLANMSHEIRTPMNAIIGMTEVTLETDLTDEQRENLGIVQSAAESLLVLINDILDFSKIEAGKLDLEPIPFRPVETVEAALRTLSHRASAKGLSLSADVAPDLPEVVVGDPHRLLQVLLNLVGNAIKFTARGRVEVGVALEASTLEGVVLRFSVRDEGVGIPASRQAMIFDPFSQADGSTTRRYGGTGLGLSISSRLVKMMGGSIGVESAVDRGSVFHFTARFARAASTADAGGPPIARRPKGKAPTRLRILLIDDNELNRRVEVHHLSRMGHDVWVAADGPDAVRRDEEEGPFDLVLLDLPMPGLVGFEVAALIRAAQDRRGRRCPIVGLTVDFPDEVGDRSPSGEMDARLARPIRVGDLERLARRMAVPPRPPLADDGHRRAHEPEAREGRPSADRSPRATA